ncbi:uncharacterized protein LOC144567183 isoform X1 [Carex rostrata]
MEWNLQKEIGNNYMFPSYPGGLENPSFDLNQWNGATSTSFDQFSSYNFVPTAFEDTGFDSSKSMDMSYNPVPTLSEDLALNESKLDTQRKGLCQLVKGSGCEDPDSFCLEECIQGVPDCRVLGLDQVDEIMNSLSDEDMRAMLHTAEPSQHVVDPCNKPQPLEDILTNLFNDPMNNIFYQNGIAAKNGLDAFGISLLQEDLSINPSMMSQGSMALDSSTSMNPSGSITENSILVADVEKAKIFEATALELRELEGALSRMNGRTRICFRDACYRLANDSRQLLDESKNELLEFHFDPSFNPSSRAYKAEPVEKETNVLDRAIMNLMFNPPCTEPEETWTPHDFRAKRIKRM